MLYETIRYCSSYKTVVHYLWLNDYIALFIEYKCTKILYNIPVNIGLFVRTTQIFRRQLYLMFPLIRIKIEHCWVCISLAIEM